MKRTREAEALLGITQVLGSTLELGLLLRRVAHQTARLLGADRCMISLWRDKGLVPVACQPAEGEPEPHGPEPISETPERPVGDIPAHLEAMRSRRPVVVDDARADRRVLGRLVDEFGVRSALVIPLIRQDEVLGTLDLYYGATAGHAWDPGHVDLAMTLAGHIAIAVDNVQILERAGREKRLAQVRLAQVSRLARLSQLVSSSLEFQHVLDLVAESVLELLGGDLARLWVVDEAAGMMRMASFKTRAAEEMADGGITAFPLGQGVVGWVVEHRRKRYSPDLREEPLMINKDWVRGRGYVTQIVVPLLVGDRPVGALAMMTKTPRTFSSEEEDLLEAFADQAAIAIENARRFAATERRRRAAEALAEVGRALAESLDSQGVDQRIAESVRTLLDVRMAVVFRLDAKSTRLLVSRTASDVPGLGEGGARVPPRATVAGLAIKQRAPVAVPDVLADPRVTVTPELRRLVEMTGLRSALALPLVFQGAVVGALSLSDRPGRRFGDEEIRLAQAFADQAAVALENARLYQEVDRRAKHAEALRRIGLSLTATHDPQQVLAQVAEEARRLVGALFTFVATRETPFYRIAAVAGDDQGYRDILKVSDDPASPQGRGVLGRAVQTRTPAVCEDILTDPLFAPWREMAAARGIRSMVAVPVFVRDEPYGVLLVYSPTPRACDIETLSLLVSLSAQAAAALENARLHAETEDRRRVAESLAELGRVVSASLDPYEVGRRLAERTRILFGARRVAVYRLDSESGNLHVFGSATEADDPFAEAATFPPGMGAVGLAVRDRRMVVSPDALADPAIVLTPEARLLFERQGVASVLATPLLLAGTVIGALAIADRPGRVFGEEEQRLAEAVANQAAVALENARLYEAAHAQRRRLTQILESTTDGILFVGPDGRVEAANRRAADLLVVDHGALVGADLVAVLARQAGQADPLFEATLRSILHETEGTEGDLPLAPLKRVLHWVTQPTRDTSGEVLGLTVTFQDVTREREVSQMKSDFVSFVTHQLRTPLSGIKWLLELAGQADAVPEGTRSYIKDAHGASERLITLVNELLDISRLERGKLEVHPEPTDVAAVTRSVLEEMRTLVEDKGHRLSVTTAPELPAVLVDRQLIRQVILNLTSNAVKYTPPGGDIAIRVERNGSWLRWAIQDTGIGIPLEAQRRLFEKFYRADNVYAVETEGTGLGLYLVRLLVEGLGGRVGCESREGRGSTFFFTLPLLEPPS